LVGFLKGFTDLLDVIMMALMLASQILREKWDSLDENDPVRKSI
jgi:hypothetical protein